MYYFICHKGRDWNPAEPCVLAASIYPDYESGDRVFPAGTEDFGGLTVLSSFPAAMAADAIVRGAAIYSNIPEYFGVVEDYE